MDASQSDTISIDLDAPLPGGESVRVRGFQRLLMVQPLTRRFAPPRIKFGASSLPMGEVKKMQPDVSTSIEKTLLRRLGGPGLRVYRACRNGGAGPRLAGERTDEPEPLVLRQQTLLQPGPQLT